MKTKVLALLWEETRVGGAIALTALFGGLVTLFMLSINLTSRGGNPGGDPFPLIATLAFPVMTVLLLTLNTANSGHLIGGFSRRILRLPVETWSTVLVILITRLCTVLLVSAIMVAAAWGLFGEGPGADTILLLGMAYLLVQVLDWSRDAALHVVVAVIAVLTTFLVLNPHWVSLLLHRGDGVPWNPVLLALAFVPAVAVAYGISVAAVHYARKGAKLNLLAVLPTLELPNARGISTSESFSSPLAAQVWYEVRRAGLFLPVMTVLFWIAFVGLEWLITRNTDAAGKHGATGTYEFYPVLAFLCAMGAWNLRMNRVGGWRKSRPGSYLLRLPVAPIDFARARTIAAFLSFAAVFAVVTVISRLAFLFLDNGIILWFLREAYANGEISGREIAGLMIGAPLIVGVIAWSLMHLSGRFIIVETILIIAYAFYSQTHMDEIVLFLLACAIVFLPLAWFGKVCLDAVRSGRLPAGSLGACMLVWAAIGLAIFPYETASMSDYWWVSVAGCAAVAVLPVFAFVHGLLRLPGHPTARVLSSRGSSRLRIAGLGLLTAALLAVAWLRGTTEPAYENKLRAEGLPATFEELKALYPSIPREMNLAERYLHAGATLEALAARWTEERQPRVDGAHLQHGLGERHLLLSGVILVGNTDYADTDPIPQAIWDSTLDYWNNVGGPVSEELHAAAESGLTRSRYPYEFDDIHYNTLRHLGSLGDLAAHLYLKIILNSINGSPEEIAVTVRDIFPLAESLKDEPFLISQMRRFAIHERVPLGLQSALSRRVFSDAQLGEFMSILEQNRPGSTEGPLTEKALLGEMLTYVKWSKELLRSGSVNAGELRAVDGLPHSSIVVFSMLAPVTEGLGWDALERVVNIRTYFMNMEEYRRDKQRGYVGKDDRRDEIWTDHLFANAPMSSIRGPSMWGMRNEWQMAVRFDAARTALAVERYRLTNGRLPGGLEELVPQYLEHVPLDPFRENAPLSYRVGADGGFAVYSFGSDREDDGGTSERGQDLCFEVPALELRTRPQVQ